MLLEILEQGRYCHLVLAAGLDKYSYLEKQDRSFIRRLVSGTVERCLMLDDALGQFSRTPPEKMKPVIRTILRMSVYQILYMDRVPDSAACNEAVLLAGKRGFRGLTGFVNGVLRNIVRQISICIISAKGKLNHLHSREAAFLKHLVNLRCKISKVFRNFRNLSKSLLYFIE